MDKRSIFRESLCLILLLMLLIFSNIIIKSINSESKVVNKISSSIEKIQDKHDSIAAYFKNNFQSIIESPEKFYPTNEENNPAIYILKNDTLVYWNSDLNDPNHLLKLHSEKNIFIQGNNQFFVTLTQNDSVKFFASTLLCHKNPNAPDNDIYLPEKINGAYSLDFLINDNQINFNINYQAKMNQLDSYLLGILLIIIFIISLSAVSHRPSAIRFFISSSIIYLIIIFLQNNLFISTSDLFGNSCLNPDCRLSFSLGSLAEFTILLFANIIVFTFNIKKEISLRNSVRIILSCLIFIFILLTYTYLIYELISNINIPFSFLEIYNTTINSYIFLILIAALTCSVIIILQSLMKIFISERQSYIWSIVAFLMIGALYEIIANRFIGLRFSLITNIVGILFYLSIVWEKKSRLKIKEIIRNIIVITLMTTQLTYILYLVKENREYEEMSWFANVVGDESDKNFENAILETVEKLKNDNNLISWQNRNDFPSDDSILNYFNQKYFNTDDIKDYYKVVTLCDTSTILVLEDLNEVNCNDLFSEILELNHTRNISEELTLVDDPTTDSYYILKLDLSPIDSSNTNICYIEFYKEYILNYIGIPEIITSSENVILPKLVNYSFSCYEGNVLQYKYGNYNYPNELNNFRYKDEEYVKTKIFKHLIKNIDDNKTIIVTIEKPRFIDIIAPFSYIFIILILMYFLNVKLHKKEEINNYKLTLHAKMQLTIILTLGLSFIVAGITSFIFMRNSLNDKTFEFQYEKNKSIVKNIEKDLDKELITEYDYLKNYKENYFLDINIYDVNGNLVNTTQPKLFDGFKSKIINRKAYESIKIRNRFYFSNEETIDGIKYTSSYFPLKDKNGNTQAIINIPYFDNNIKSKINVSNFVITYLNIILVLMGASALVVILVTRNTIKPLKIIQDKMQKISLTGKNEKIEWNSKDEIGELITIYNNLIKELEISANKLMRSERETAWREMARQVAHEIKNPLTPMKLNIQFLQMAWDEKNPDIDRKLRDTTNTLLEQIDILSNIATAFSNYAKLPQKNIERFNIKELIVNTINLYDNNPNIDIVLKEENDSDYIIDSDRNNLSIVFGNIIKNAIQAIGKKDDGNITITIKDVKEFYNIEIRDNGCGIGEEAKKKIFMPNFTTKSSGMGVGLSIVYDILETLNSDISFESEVGVGTIFRINIKK